MCVALGHSGQNDHLLTHKKSTKFFAQKYFFTSFEAQKLTFSRLFGRENLKICEKLAPKFEKITKNSAKFVKK